MFTSCYLWIFVMLFMMINLYNAQLPDDHFLDLITICSDNTRQDCVEPIMTISAIITPSFYKYFAKVSNKYKSKDSYLLNKEYFHEKTDSYWNIAICHHSKSDAPGIVLKLIRFGKDSTNWKEGVPKKALLSLQFRSYPDIGFNFRWKNIRITTKKTGGIGTSDMQNKTIWHNILSKQNVKLQFEILSIDIMDDTNHIINVYHIYDDKLEVNYQYEYKQDIDITINCSINSTQFKEMFADKSGNMYIPCNRFNKHENTNTIWGFILYPYGSRIKNEFNAGIHLTINDCNDNCYAITSTSMYIPEIGFGSIGIDERWQSQGVIGDEIGYSKEIKRYLTDKKLTLIAHISNINVYRFESDTDIVISAVIRQSFWKYFGKISSKFKSERLQYLLDKEHFDPKTNTYWNVAMVDMNDEEYNGPVIVLKLIRFGKESKRAKKIMITAELTSSPDIGYNMKWSNKIIDTEHQSIKIIVYNTVSFVS